jgi:hypothetical protein
MKQSFFILSLFICVFPQQTVAALKPCNLDEKLHCPEKYRDGCLVKNNKGESLTTHHVCVKAGEENTFAKCSQVLPYQKNCAKNEKPACSHKPPVSIWKICFLLPQ